MPSVQFVYKKTTEDTTAQTISLGHTSNTPMTKHALLEIRHSSRTFSRGCKSYFIKLWSFYLLESFTKFKRDGSVEVFYMENLRWRLKLDCLSDFEWNFP